MPSESTTQESPAQVPFDPAPWEKTVARYSWESFTAFREQHRDTPTLCAGAIYGEAFLAAIRMFLPPSGLVVHAVCEGCGATLIGPWDQREQTLELGRLDGWDEGHCVECAPAVGEPCEGRR